MITKQQRILIAGAHGMVGKALWRHFLDEGYHNLLTPSRKELDLTQQHETRAYLKRCSPDVIVVAAAKVGGIFANQSFPAPFLYDNLMISANLIHAAHECGIHHLLFLGSSCIYPKMAPQPIREEALFTGSLESTNEAYALAKIAGVKLCEFYAKQYGRRYFSLMPTNLYGPNDHYHPTHSHVIPGLMRRFHEAKMQQEPFVTIWGTGRALREFLYVEDLAAASLFFLTHPQTPSLINVGSGEEITIQTLAEIISQIVGYKGDIKNDLSMPDGTPRKRLDLSKLHGYGWRAKMGLREGLQRTYRDFLEQEGACVKYL